MAFRKVAFCNTAYGCTAGLVVDDTRHNVNDLVGISRLYPASEFRKMTTYHVSPAYTTFDEAFSHVFDLDIMGNPAPRQSRSVQS